MNNTIQQMTQLTLETFNIHQLMEWNEEARRRYPNFEMVLLVRHDEYKWCCFYFRPLPTAYQVIADSDFPWKPYWADLDLFFDSLFGTFPTDIELTFSCYPDEASFSTNEPMEDWQLERNDNDRDLLTVSQLMEFFSDNRVGVGYGV